MTLLFIVYFFFFKQKTAYEMRISDWSSDVCSSDLLRIIAQATVELVLARYAQLYGGICENVEISLSAKSKLDQTIEIELGSNGCQPTGVCIPTDTLIISTGYNDAINAPYVRITERLRLPSHTMAM